MTNNTTKATEALAAVEGVRVNGGSPKALADALLDLSHALDREARDDEAGAAVREGIETLTPSFLANPPPFAPSMRALLAQYISLAGRGSGDLDPFLILPVAAELGALGSDTAAEGSADPAKAS